MVRLEIFQPYQVEKNQQPAIALRLSIALFLSEGTKSLLILDEILASMDENRQQLILETIKDLPNAQVILVAHSQVANSYADKLITL